MTSHSCVYVKMHPVFSADSPDSPYMNLLYSAVQRQGGTGCVETAVSPYLAMTGNGNVRKIEERLRGLGVRHLRPVRVGR